MRGWPRGLWVRGWPQETDWLQVLVATGMLLRLRRQGCSRLRSSAVRVRGVPSACLGCTIQAVQLREAPSVQSALSQTCLLCCCAAAAAMLHSHLLGHA